MLGYSHKDCRQWTSAHEKYERMASRMGRTSYGQDIMGERSSSTKYCFSTAVQQKSNTRVNNSSQIGKKSLYVDYIELSLKKKTAKYDKKSLIFIKLRQFFFLNLLFKLRFSLLWKYLIPNLEVIILISVISFAGIFLFAYVFNFNNYHDNSWYTIATKWQHKLVVFMTWVFWSF